MFSAIAHLWRLFRTGATFERTGAMAVLLDEFGVDGWPRLVIRSLARPVGLFGRVGDPNLPPVARAIQAMGPAYVKFGQVLSTRPDVVGPNIVGQLRYLQDRLPPFPIEEARATLLSELGPRGGELIGELDPAVAAASIAQVHPAIWKPTGEKVAVKVLRPNVRERFRRDIGGFYFIAGLLEALVPGTRRLRPRAVVQHFEGVVTTELDLRLEASSASEYRDTVADQPKVKVPRIFWEGTGRKVLTMEWIDGRPLDPEALAGLGLDLTELSNRIIQVFLRTALSDGFFHADMHQGNLRVGDDGTLLVMDFGIMGRLDPMTRRHYAEILFGFLRRDYIRIAEVHFEAGYVPPDRDVEAFAMALRSIGEPIFGQDVSQISMARLLAFLFEVTERFGMQTRTELILLQRTMVVVEGVSRSIDPHCNIWKAAAPVVEEWITDNLSPKQTAKDMLKTARVLSRLGPRLPDLAQELVMLAEEARIRRRTGAGGGPVEVSVVQLSRRNLTLAVLAGAAGGAGAVALISRLL